MMKFLTLSTLILLSALTASAQEYQLWPDSSKINIDGTETIINPRLVRGNKNYLVSGYPGGICRALGFENYLADTGVVDITNEQTAIINANGDYYSHTTPNGNRFYSSISCYKNSMQKTVIKTSLFDENADRTVTFTEPRLVRGMNSYLVSGSPEGVCKAMGYDNFLADSGFFGTTNEQTTVINKYGSYYSLTTPNGNRYFREITCYTRKPLTILVDSRGDFYFKRN